MRENRYDVVVVGGACRGEAALISDFLVFLLL